MNIFARPCLRVLLPGLVLLALGACTGVGRLSEDPPAGYSIAGTWTLNPALSTDTRKALASLNPGAHRGERPQGEQNEVINDPTTDLPPADAASGGGGGGGGGRARQDTSYRPPIDVQTDVLSGGEWLKIAQGDTEVVITNAATSRSFTPGESSVVSVPTGVADQRSGWSGGNYVIDIRPQVGPRVTERYGLAPDGRQLLVQIKVDSEGRNRAITVKRVYDRTATVPQGLPAEN